MHIDKKGSTFNWGRKKSTLQRDDSLLELLLICARGELASSNRPPTRMAEQMTANQVCVTVPAHSEVIGSHRLHGENCYLLPN
jgi:hypothetical protein